MLPVLRFTFRQVSITTLLKKLCFSLLQVLSKYMWNFTFVFLATLELSPKYSNILWNLKDRTDSTTSQSCFLSHNTTKTYLHLLQIFLRLAPSIQTSMNSWDKSQGLKMACSNKGVVTVTCCRDLSPRVRRP